MCALSLWFSCQDFLTSSRAPTGKHWQNNIIPLSLRLYLHRSVFALFSHSLSSLISPISSSLSYCFSVHSLSRGSGFSRLHTSILPPPSHSLILLIRPVSCYTPPGPNLTPISSCLCWRHNFPQIIWINRISLDKGCPNVHWHFWVANLQQILRPWRQESMTFCFLTLNCWARCHKKVKEILFEPLYS